MYVGRLLTDAKYWTELNIELYTALTFSTISFARIFIYSRRLHHHLGLGGKRPESTDTDDAGDDKTPPHSPAPSDIGSDSDLSLGTNSPPPPNTSISSQSSISSPNHNHNPASHPLSAMFSSSFPGLQGFGPTIPIPASLGHLGLPAPGHITMPPHHHLSHHALSPGGLFPSLAHFHGLTSAMSMQAANAATKGFFNMGMDLHRPFLKQSSSPERSSSSWFTPQWVARVVEAISLFVVVVVAILTLSIT